MPLYEYECKACHRRTEKRQKFSDPEITECPFCGGELERVISAPAIAFKGGGWYADGYGNAKPKPAGGESKGESAPASAEGSKNEGSKSEGSRNEGSRGEGSKGEAPKNSGSSSENTSSGASAPASSPAPAAPASTPSSKT